MHEPFLFLPLTRPQPLLLHLSSDRTKSRKEAATVIFRLRAKSSSRAPPFNDSSHHELLRTPTKPFLPLPRAPAPLLRAADEFLLRRRPALVDRPTLCLSSPRFTPVSTLYPLCCSLAVCLDQLSR